MKIGVGVVVFGSAKYIKLVRDSVCYKKQLKKR